MNENNKYQPNLTNGATMYNDIDSVGGRNIDFSKPIINIYSWQEFTDLVAFERQAGIYPKYSAMLAICLMKKTLLGYKFHNEGSFESFQDAYITFLNSNYIKVLEVLPKWDYNSGVYFNTYYNNWIHDALRETLQLTAVKQDISINNNPTEDDFLNANDNLEYQMMNTPYAIQRLELTEFSSAEDIYISKEKQKINNILFEELENKNNFIIDKKLAQVTAFLKKFCDGVLLENPKYTSSISNILKPIIEKSQSKKRKRYKTNESYQEEFYKENEYFENYEDLDFSKDDNELY